MTNRKSTKRALLGSVMAMVLCLAMLVGATFAWFTDTASTGVNKIQAGNLDVQLQYATAWDEKGNVTSWADAASAIHPSHPEALYHLPLHQKYASLHNPSVRRLPYHARAL